MKSETPETADELDLIKVYIWVMVAFTVALAGVLYFTYSKVQTTDGLIERARKSMDAFPQQKAEIEAMLKVYTTNKEDEARRQPATWFSRVWQRKLIPNESIKLDAWQSKYVNKGNYYEERIELDFQSKAPLSRQQIGEFCHEVERASTRLRTLELQLRRPRKDDLESDSWYGKVTVGYRTAKVNE